MAGRPRRSSRTGPMVKDKDQLDEIHDKWKYADDRWADIRKDAKIDMRHVLNNPWPDSERTEREKNSRPVVATDEISQYQNQVTNDIRQNKRGIEFSPEGDGANDETARFYGNKARQVEYSSDASTAYDGAITNAVQRSYGYVKLETVYQSDTPKTPDQPGSAFNQEFRIRPVPDPDAIWPDPDFTDRTGRDWRWLFDVESRSKDDFLREFPKAEVRNFTPELVKYSDGWISQDRVQLAQFWERTFEKKTILGLMGTDAQGQQQALECWEDDQDAIALLKTQFTLEPAKSREVQIPSVTQYLTNGVEILKTTPWVGKWIPYVGCFGPMIWTDLGKGPQLVILSMTRFARDPNLLLAYYTSTEAELIGMTPKIPYFVWDGSLSNKEEAKLAKSNKVPVPFVKVRPKLSTSTQDTPGFPMKQDWNPPMQAVEIGKENARRSIQAAMGLTFLPSSAQNRSEKSGIALREIHETGQKGAYYWTDAYNATIVRVGELLEDGFPKLHDTAGWQNVRDAKGQPQRVYVAKGQPAPQGIPPDQVLPDIEGTHSVTISVGPRFASERERAQNFVSDFLASPFFAQLPPPMQLQIGALLIKLQDLGPIGQDIVDVMQPQANGKGPKPEQLIPQMQDALKKGEQIVQTLQAKIQAMEAANAAKVTETQGKLAIEAAKGATETGLETMRQQAETDRATAKDDTAVQLQEMKDRIALLEMHLTSKIEGETLAQDTVMQERERAHAADQAAEAADRAAEQEAINGTPEGQ